MSGEMISLKENYEFTRAYKRGKSVVHWALVVYIFKNKTKNNRVGITTSKKIGKAVTRNRARRVIRAAYRQNEELLKTGYDFVFVARAKTAEMKSDDLARIMKKLFEKGKVINEKPADQPDTVL